MEELDLLKKAWQNDEHASRQVSEKEIYKMLHKKSSSIVKWILIISILEFLVWTLLSFCMQDTDFVQKLNKMHVEAIMLPMSVIGYIVLAYFFFQFYMNYRKIQVTDDAKKLIRNILKTRKTVYQYMWFNIIYFIVGIITVTLLQFQYDQDTIALLDRYTKNGSSSMMFYCIYAGITVVVTALFVVMIWLFYKLIYGILLKRLHKNHEELKKIDL